MLSRFASRFPRPPALVVSDSDALTPYMSHVVPGCEFLLLTVAPPGLVAALYVVMSNVPAACQPLCAPYLAAAVAATESIVATNRPSLPRRSFRSTYSRQASRRHRTRCSSSDPGARRTAASGADPSSLHGSAS